MTTSATDPKPSAPTSPTLQNDRLSQMEGAPRTNWTVIVPIALISAVVLLVGLPVGAVMIINNTSCCLAIGPEKLITFWASMIAGFLALFGMVVTGVFVITAFRVDATARAKAQLAARDEVWNYVRNYDEKLANELAALLPIVEERAEQAKRTIDNAKKEVEAQQGDASTAIAGARSETTSAADGARRAISVARDEATDAARRAREAIGGVEAETGNAAVEAQRAIAEGRNQTIDAANGAQEAIVALRHEVERQRTEAIPAIDNAQQEVEAAAQEARDRIGRAGGSPGGEGRSD